MTQEQEKLSYQLTQEGVLAMTELASEGAKTASSALSKLIEQNITVNAFGVRMVDMVQICEVVNGKDTASVIDMNLHGEVNGKILLVYPFQSALNIVDLISKRPLGSSTILSAMENSALKESGNIIAGAFLGAISDFSGVNMLESVPDLHTDNFANVVTKIIETIKKDEQEAEAIVFETHSEMASLAPSAEKVVPEIRMNAFFILILDIASTNKLFEALRNKRGKGPLTEAK